jgi:protein-tyrosine phosphatase
LIDVHCHLLPGVDDGCKTLDESIAVARQMIAAGYTHAVCTPHIWPNFPHNNAANIPRYVARLQEQFDRAGVAMRLLPGGEINLRHETLHTPTHELVTYNLAGKFVLFDLWAGQLPDFFEPTVRWFQRQNIQPIIAHPERMEAVQKNPALADYFAQIGLLMQGNLYCLTDSPLAPAVATRLARQFLTDGRYFLLGSDNHTPDTVHHRLAGLQVARDLVGESVVHRLLHEHPLQLLG